MKGQRSVIDPAFGLSKKECVVIDAHEQIANLVYNNSYGVIGHILAHKIYESDGEVELSEQEIQTIEPVVVRGCAAPIIDAILIPLELDPQAVVSNYQTPTEGLCRASARETGGAESPLPGKESLDQGAIPRY